MTYKSVAMYEFGADPVWDEFGAALYESYHADINDPNDAYVRTAHRLCEELEYAIYDAEIAEEHYNY